MLDFGRQLGHVVERRRTETALRESMARLAEVAATDPLTGLRNRREFDRLLATIPGSASPSAPLTSTASSA